MRPPPTLAWLTLAAGALSTGCYTANGYAPPRTLAPGDATAAIAPEGFLVTGKRTPTGTGPFPAGHRETVTGASVLPTLAGRLGLSDRVDGGVYLRQVGVLGADLKWNFLRGDTFDAAVAPGVQALPTAFYLLDLPFPVGMRLGPRVTLFATPGAAVAVVPLKTTNQDSITPPRGAMARLGVGLQVLLFRRVAILPEMTAMRSFDEHATTWLSLGLGLRAGGLPEGERAAAAGEVSP